MTPGKYPLHLPLSTLSVTLSKENVMASVHAGRKCPGSQGKAAGRSSPGATPTREGVRTPAPESLDTGSPPENLWDFPRKRPPWRNGPVKHRCLHLDCDRITESPLCPTHKPVPRTPETTVPRTESSVPRTQAVPRTSVVDDGSCSTCAGPRDREGQRTCRSCHAAAQRVWRNDPQRKAADAQRKRKARASR